MKAALAVNIVTRDVSESLRHIEELAHSSATAGADLVLFPEAAITGLINQDVPELDLPLGEVIPGAMTNGLAG